MKENVEQLFKTSCDNLKWFEENHDSLIEEYDNKWIIVQNKKIVATDSDFESIMEALKKHDPKTALVEYMHSEQIAMFF
jgi:hypothetical protein